MHSSSQGQISTDGSKAFPARSYHVSCSNLSQTEPNILFLGLLLVLVQSLSVCAL